MQGAIMRRETLWIFLCLSSVACATHRPLRQPAGDSLFERFPVSQVFRLSNGTDIDLPYRSRANYTFLGGAVDVDALNALLAREDLVAVPTTDGVPDPQGTVTVGIYMIDYTESTVGAYHELLINTLAKSTKPAGVDRYGYYCLNIKVDSKTSMIAGREIGGYPKTLARLDLSRAGDHVFSVASGASEEFSGRCADCESIPTAPQELRFNFISPYRIRKTWYEFTNLGPVGFRPYDPARDSFRLSGRGSAGKLLSGLKFTPLYWMVGKDVEVVTSGGS
jgi:hypothetical protein